MDDVGLVYTSEYLCTRTPYNTDFWTRFTEIRGNSSHMHTQYVPGNEATAEHLLKVTLTSTIDRIRIRIFSKIDG